jgi:hypothetical protein
MHPFAPKCDWEKAFGKMHETSWNQLAATVTEKTRRGLTSWHVSARLGTSWDRTKWPWRRRNRHPQTGEPSSGSHSFQKCSVSWTCLALSFTKGTRCTSSNVKRCEEMWRDVKWCETQVYHSCTKLKWCLSLTSKCSHICGFPFLDVHPARAWDTSVSTVSTYRTVVERWFTSPSDKNSPSHPLPENCSLWISV